MKSRLSPPRRARHAPPGRPEADCGELGAPFQGGAGVACGASEHTDATVAGLLMGAQAAPRGTGPPTGTAENRNALAPMSPLT